MSTGLSYSRIPAYPSILGVFNRSQENPKNVAYGSWSTPALSYLQLCTWRMREKVDGINTAVILQRGPVWAEFRGRREGTQLPPFVIDMLREKFPMSGEYEKLVGDYYKLVLFGESYGNRIQGVGSKYIKDGVDFILFDCLGITWSDGPVWLGDDDVAGIAASLGLKMPPVILEGPLMDGVNAVEMGVISRVAQAPDTLAEGLVARPIVPLFDAHGARIITKIKTRDLYSKSVYQATYNAREDW